jgi:hypothetical protein
MTIKIPVQADTGSTAQELDKVSQSAEGIAQSVQDIDRASRQAAQGLGQVETAVRRIEVTAERLARIQEILGHEYGRPASEQEARTTAENFDSMRANRNLMGGSRIRKFSTFEEWYEGNRQQFVNPADAERYKQNVMGMATAGTGIQPTDNGGGGGQGGSGFFQNAASRGMSSGKAFAGGMLALAGVTSVMAMAGRAADMATEEAVGADTLKRTMGDLGIDFENLRDQLRGAGDGLGVASVEAVRLAQHFAKIADADQRTDIAAEVRNAIGFGRSFGIDPNESATFFAHMRQFQVTSVDDPNSRRMAILIADAIERGQATGKADELIAAVSTFTAQAARITLTRPNAEGYLGAVAGMTRTGLAGMTPSLAAEILGAADSATRRGGAMGEASLNFSYAALSRQNPGIDPIQAMMLLEGGMFGSASSVFGKDSPLSRYAPAGALSTTTNWEAMKQQFQSLGWSEPLTIDALKNHFGLQSYAQAETLYRMSPEQLGGTRSLLDRAGVDPNTVSADSLQMLSSIAGEQDPGVLRGSLFQQLRSRSDLSGTSAALLDKAAAGGDIEALRLEMAKAAAAMGQEKTPGTEIRDSVTTLNDTLTRIGGGVLTVLEGIRMGVSALVTTIAPNSPAAMRFQREEEIGRLQQAVAGQEAEYESEQARMQALVDNSSGAGGRSTLQGRMNYALQSLSLMHREQRDRLNRLLREREADAGDASQGALLNRMNLPGQAANDGMDALIPALQSIDPKAGQRADAQRSEFRFYHEIQVQDQQGRPRADPIRVNTRVDEPVAAGANR